MTGACSTTGVSLGAGVLGAGAGTLATAGAALEVVDVVDSVLAVVVVVVVVVPVASADPSSWV
jgi:hypothetical protein